MCSSHRSAPLSSPHHTTCRSVLDEVIRAAAVAVPHEDPSPSTRPGVPPPARRARSFYTKSKADPDEAAVPMVRWAPSAAPQPAKSGKASRVRLLPPAPSDTGPAGAGKEGLAAPLLGAAAGEGGGSNDNGGGGG